MIVTFRFENSLYDLQVPTDVTVGDLIVWVLAYVNQLACAKLQPNNVALVLDRKEEIIRTDMTLDEVGVRNGDYITILNMG